MSGDQKKGRYTITHWEADEYVVVGPRGPVGGTGHKQQILREAILRNDEAHIIDAEWRAAADRVLHKTHADFCTGRPCECGVDLRNAALLRLLRLMEAA